MMRTSVSARAGLLLLGSLLTLGGCVGTGRPAPPLTSFDLDYPPPALPGKPPLDVSLTVQFVAGSQALASTDMWYQTAPYRRSSYNYDRWVSSPPDLLSVWLTRDLARSGLFKAAFTATSGMDARFLLQGTVEQFLEVDRGPSGVARVELLVALVDTRTPAGTRAILFQKGYSAEHAMPSQTGEGLAAGMSAAVSEVTKSIIADVYAALAADNPPATAPSGIPGGS
jgi:ABC-type uncharacterized transport system auxiliary subunit